MKDKLPAFLLQLIFAYAHVMWATVLYPAFSEKYEHPNLAYVAAVFALLTYYNLIVCHFTDPGVIFRGRNLTEMKTIGAAEGETEPLDEELPS